MAFPVVESLTETAFPTATTSHLVNMPATVNSGDLLLVFMMARDGVVTISTPAGWTQKWQSSTRGGGWTKVADGTEGGTTVNFTTGGDTARAAAQCYRISGWFNDLAGVEVGTAATGSSTTPNPPALTPSWGALDTLWFAVATGRSDDATVSAYPTNYTNGSNKVSGSGAGTGCNQASARRELNGISDNPGTFTLSLSQDWAAQTVAIRPAAAAGVTGPIFI